MADTTRSGIQTSADGSSYIPASKRSDGSTRKEIRVRPGYKPPEDIDAYKNRTAEAWRSRGQGGVPGADPVPLNNVVSDTKSQNAKRREAARRNKATSNASTAEMLAGKTESGATSHKASENDRHRQNQSQDSVEAATKDEEADRQKKIRNQLKKLKGARELKEKKLAGEKLSPDQLMKISREPELLRDLKKLGYEGDELHELDNGGTINQSTTAVG